jgi:hypothetical protein
MAIFLVALSLSALFNYSINESERIKTAIIRTTFTDGSTISIIKADGTRLIVYYSSVKATKDEYNRRRGLNR